MNARDQYLAEITGANKAQAMLTRLRKGVQAQNARNQAAGLTVKQLKAGSMQTAVRAATRKAFSQGDKVAVQMPGTSIKVDGEVVGAAGRTGATKVRILSGNMAGVHDIEDRYLTAKSLRRKAFEVGATVTVTLPDADAQDGTVVGAGASEGTTKVKLADGSEVDVQDSMIAAKSLKSMTFAQKAAYYTRRDAAKRKDGMALDPTLTDDEEEDPVVPPVEDKDDMMTDVEPTPEDAVTADPELPPAAPTVDDPVAQVAAQVADMIPTLANLAPEEQIAEIANVLQQLLDDQPVIEIEDPAEEAAETPDVEAAEGDAVDVIEPIDDTVTMEADPNAPPADDEELDENGNPIIPKEWTAASGRQIKAGQARLIEEMMSGQALMVETLQEMQNEIKALHDQVNKLPASDAVARVAAKAQSIEADVQRQLKMRPRAASSAAETLVDEPELMRKAARDQATYDARWGGLVTPPGTVAYQGE